MKHEAPTSGRFRCKTCGEELPAIYFAVARNNAHGLQHECRRCISRRSSDSAAAKRRSIERLERRKRKFRLAYGEDGVPS